VIGLMLAGSSSRSAVLAAIRTPGVRGIRPCGKFMFFRSARAVNAAQYDASVISVTM
tara:strand:- start:435 stop:605 length:171 start_codon:yes stop_codon:yes gene_type:complete